MAVINPEKIAAEIAEAAQELITPRFRALEEHEISSKSHPNDLVTMADIEMEQRLKQILPNHLPGAIVMGEEGITKGEDSLEARLRSKGFPGRSDRRHTQLR